MVDAVNGAKLNDISKIEEWKKLRPSEIRQKQAEGAEVPPEILAWAADIEAYGNIPDDVTYDVVGGATGIEALNQLNIPVDEQVGNVESEEEAGTEENPETENPPESEIPENGLPKDSADVEDIENPDDFSLADSAITADNNEIRKRKERKGIL
ncbi:MAG: hypothetical protein K6C94_08010 [Candidatus Gastranaerophilales bacterium]|nr:hypothetical protein [Candidatus Gastranaerophilales bacterium]